VRGAEPKYCAKLATGWCLTEEIRILQPTAVVFFSGPNYDEALRDEFPGLQFAGVDERRYARRFAKVIHNSLPDRSFRSYHPGYLVRNEERWSWVEEIAALATQQLQPGGTRRHPQIAVPRVASGKPRR
jgi:hypothetical protein